MKRTLDELVRDLIWNICNQREKVPSNLITLIPMLYPNVDKETQRKIQEELIKKIG